MPKPRIVYMNLIYLSSLSTQELFSGIGPLRFCNLVHPGRAEVVFNSPKDAQAAVARYNGRELDGRPMIVTLVTHLQPNDALKSSER